MKAQIITIGDEILIGQIVDTNSAWLAVELNQLGIALESIQSISDTSEAIFKALNHLPADVHLVLMTGGLGPTKDDITKVALERWFDCGWREDDEVKARVTKRFMDRGIPMPQVNLSQAKVPACCQTLQNDLGTAPGMWFEKDDRIFISMPGVPYEMMHIFSERAKSKIQLRFNLPPIIHRTILTQGIGESTLMGIIEKWEDALAEDDIKLAYLPSAGAVRLRLSSFNVHDRMQAIMERKVNEVLPLIQDYSYGFDSDNLALVVGRLLKKGGFTVSAAESCTGGRVAGLFTANSGSSAYFSGSVTAYANSAKVNVLGVSQQVIDQHGAVSEAVVRQMAEGANRVFNTNFSVATSGVAGPDGGTIERPVGTVWFAVAGPLGTTAIKMHMGADRLRNIDRSAIQALQLLRKEVLRTLKISQIDSLYLKE